MMKIFFSIVLLGSSLTLMAQKMEKQEAKVWKEKLKATSVDEFKALHEGITKDEAKIAQYQKTTQDNNNQALSKDDELSVLKQKAKQLEKETAEVDASDKSDKGIVFKVQIGAFEKVDITSQANSQKTDLTAERDNNVKKYAVGYFRDYWQADKFKKCLQNQGITDAWIVAYKDGKRVDIKDVLKEVI